MLNTGPGGNYSKQRTAAIRKKTCKRCVVLSTEKTVPEGSHSREPAMQSDIPLASLSVSFTGTVSASMK